MDEKTIAKIYRAIKSGEAPNTGRFSPGFIKDCYKFGYLREKPSKKHLKWFEEAFECQYPKYLKDISKRLEKELKTLIKQRKEAEKQEAKWKAQRGKRGYSDADCLHISGWFLKLMPKMLQQMRDNLHGYPSGLFPNNQAVSDTAIDENAEEEPEFTKWKETLDRMIFLLKEMDEETCSFENPYEKEYYQICDDFCKKYGFFGEGLKSEEELEAEKECHASRMYFPTDFPDLYPTAGDVTHSYLLYEQYKKGYINQCREEFFFLFSKYFYCLWD